MHRKMADDSPPDSISSNALRRAEGWSGSQRRLEEVPHAMTQPDSKPKPAARSNAVDRQDMLDYIHAMLGQLRGMAEAEKLDMLAYLIDMARVEVSEVLRSQLPQRTRSRRGGVHR